jgi:hypothetical protein
MRAYRGKTGEIYAVGCGGCGHKKTLWKCTHLVPNPTNEAESSDRMEADFEHSSPDSRVMDWVKSYNSDFDIQIAKETRIVYLEKEVNDLREEIRSRDVGHARKFGDLRAMNRRNQDRIRELEDIVAKVKTIMRIGDEENYFTNHGDLEDAAMALGDLFGGVNQ